MTDLGPTQLKNIAEPVRAYSLQVGVPAAAKFAAPASRRDQRSAPRRRSVRRSRHRYGNRRRAYRRRRRHLAFRRRVESAATIAQPAASLPGRKPRPISRSSCCRSPTSPAIPTQDYFADGITENLTTDLSRLSGSFVIARNTAFTFKGKNVDAREIGKELGVRYVLEGSVQRDQNQVRVNAQLIDAESGGHLWAERFDKPLSNLFSMQDEIVASLASQLGAELISQRGSPRGTDAKSRFDGPLFPGNGVVQQGAKSRRYPRAARGFFERALALDPDNLDAVVGMACADVQAATGYYVDDKAERLASVEANLNRVLSQSPNNAQAHYCLGRVLVQTKRGAQGIAECERALALNPNLASAHAVIGLAKVFDGHPEETESHERRGVARQSSRYGSRCLGRLYRARQAAISAPTRRRSACIAGRRN